MHLRRSMFRINVDSSINKETKKKQKHTKIPGFLNMNCFVETLMFWGGFSYPLSLKFRGQLSLVPKITEVVIAKTTYLMNLTIGGNFKV